MRHFKSLLGPVLALVIALLIFPLVVQAAPQIKTNISNVKPSVPGNIPPQLNGNAPPTGTIAITTPEASADWFWNKFYYVKWSYTWTGRAHAASAIVTLWKGTNKMITLPASATGQTGLTIPGGLAPGIYEVHVTNEADTRIEARQNVKISSGKVTFTAPATNAIWTSGSQQMVEWTYQGNPGPLNLVLTAGGGSFTSVVASNVALADGWGRRSITVPTTNLGGRYYMEARRTADNGLVGKSNGFTVPIPEDDCKATHVSAAGAAWEETVTATGTRLDQNCAAEFKLEGGTPAVPLSVTVQNAGQIAIKIPSFTPLGSGRIRVYPRSGQNAGSNLPVDRNFGVKSPKPNAKDCEIIAAQPPLTGNPGTEITLWGNNGMTLGCTVVFMHLPNAAGAMPEQYTAPVQPLGTYRLKVKIPMMPAGAAVVTSRLGQAAITSGMSAVVTVNEIPPVLTGLFPGSGYAGKSVVLVGQAFLPPSKPEYAYMHAQTEDLRARLTYGPNKFVDVVPSHVPNPNPAMRGEALLVKLPEVVKNVQSGGYQGTISVYRRTPTLVSATQAFKFEPVTQTQQPVTHPCNARQYIQGYSYVGDPKCTDADHPSSMLVCDENGFRCSYQGYYYAPSCSNHCGQGGCNVEPKPDASARWGCYRRNPN